MSEPYPGRVLDEILELLLVRDNPNRGRHTLSDFTPAKAQVSEVTTSVNDIRTIALDRPVPVIGSAEICACRRRSVAVAQAHIHNKRVRLVSRQITSTQHSVSIDTTTGPFTGMAMKAKPALHGPWT